MNVTANQYGHRRFGGSKSASELPISISETVVEASNHCPVPTKSLMQALDASRSFLISPRCRAYDQGRWLNGKSTLNLPEQVRELAVQGFRGYTLRVVVIGDTLHLLAVFAPGLPDEYKDRHTPSSLRKA